MQTKIYPRSQKRPVRRLSNGDCNRIAIALGLSLGEYTARDDDSRGLAFTVCGGKLVNGDDAPEWLCELNGLDVWEIAREALRRGAVRRTGRWAWERCLSNTEAREPGPKTNT